MFNTSSAAGQITRTLANPQCLGPVNQNAYLGFFVPVTRQRFIHLSRNLPASKSRQPPPRSHGQLQGPPQTLETLNSFAILREPQSFRSLATSAKLCARSNLGRADGVSFACASSPSSLSARKTRPEQWQIQKRALKKKFGEEGWAPRKRLSPDALEGIRTLHTQNPEQFSTEILANKFQISPEAIRRILRSKWRPTESEGEDRRQRWERRGESIWLKMAELGVKPPKKWREKGINRKPDRRPYNDVEDPTQSSIIEKEPSNILDLPEQSLSNRIL